MTPDERAQMLRGASDQFMTDITSLPRMLQEYLAPPTPLTLGEMRNPQPGTLENLRAENRQWDEFQNSQNAMYQQGRSLGTAGAVVADPLNYMAEAVPVIKGFGRLANMVAREAATPQGLRTMTNALANQRGMVRIPKKEEMNALLKISKGDDFIADENGLPKTFYHGTKSKNVINSFDDSKIGSANDEGFFGRGHYFTRDPDTANLYAGASGGSVYPVNIKGSKILSLKNDNTLPDSVIDNLNKIRRERHLKEEAERPDDLFDNLFGRGNYEYENIPHGKKHGELMVSGVTPSDLTLALQKDGYDGVSYKDGLELVIFDPKKIKSKFER